MRSVLLIGMGRFGMSVAKKLNEMNVQVMAVDMDEERIDSCLDIVTRAQIGDSTNEAFIATLGVSAYDACILAIDGCSLFEVQVPDEWTGLSVVDLDVRKRYGINVIGIRHDGKMDMDVGPGKVFGPDDTVLIAGSIADVQKCFRF